MRENEPDDVIDWAVTPRDELQFAVELDAEDDKRATASHEVALVLRGTPPSPQFTARFPSTGVTLPVAIKAVAGGRVELRIQVVAPTTKSDDELELELVESGSPEPLPIRFRRTRCRVETALIHPRPGGDPDRAPLGGHVRAALLWYGWNRCTRLVGIKRFDTGLSGSEVFVFRPRLAAPRLDSRRHQDDDFAGSTPQRLWTESWGSWLLVKAGGVRQVRKEWSRHDVFLRDRLTPFMARTEAMLRVRSARRSTSSRRPESSRGGATLISSFVGGDLIRADPLEFRLKGGSDDASGRGVLTRIFETLAAWHDPGEVAELSHFGRFFKDPQGQLRLFGPTLWEGEAREQFRDALASIHRQWWLCRDRTREKVNPDLHRLVFPEGVVVPDRQKLLGQLPEWAWGRVQADGKCPEPEEFVEEARRRLEEMSSSMVMTDEPRSPVPGAAGSP
jgi:hypothetical protein